MALPTRLIKAMCPERVCTVCGAPSERITGETVGWTDCECSDDGTHWRTGRVLDPFAGSGTTLVAAHNESRDAIGVDLDSRNVAMVEERLGPIIAATDLTVFT